MKKLIKDFVKLILLSGFIFGGSLLASEVPTSKTELATTPPQKESTINIRTRPLYLFMGWAFDYKISEKVTIGPEVFYIPLEIGSDQEKYQVKAYRLGFNSVYYTRGVFQDSWTITLHNSFIGLSLDEKGQTQNKSQANIQIFSMAMLGGYHFQWPSGFNMDFGVGLQKLVIISNQSSQKLKKKNIYFGNQIDTPFIAGEFSIGYTF